MASDLDAMQLRDLRVKFGLDLLHRVYAELLEPAFSVDELESEEFFRSSLVESDQDPQTLALVAVDPNSVPSDDPVGTVIGKWYQATGVLLIAYVTVRADRRGAGIGESLMRLAVERWFPSIGCTLVLGEIEDPRHFDEQEAIRRLRFHGRVGGSLLRIPYFQPRLRQDARRVHHMFLAVFASSAMARREGGVDASLLRAFLKQYFAATEGAEAVRSDPSIAWLLRFYQGDVIPLVAMARYLQVPDPEPPTEP